MSKDDPAKPDFTFPKLFVMVVEFVAVVGLFICLAGMLSADRESNFYTVELWAYFSHACRCLLLLGVALLLHVAIEGVTVLARVRATSPRPASSRYPSASRSTPATARPES
jgi:hypothetical protein